jgi:hypothetical protein
VLLFTSGGKFNTLPPESEHHSNFKALSAVSRILSSSGTAALKMDVFLESAPEWEDRPLVSRIAVSASLSALSEDDLVTEVERLQNQGVRYVAVRRQQALRFSAPRLLQILNDAGLSVSSLGYCGGYTGSMNLSFEDAMEDTARAVELAVELNARALIVLPGSRGLFTFNHIQRSIRIGLQAAISHAGQFPLRLLVPTSSLMGDDRDVFTSPAAMLNWLERQTGPRVHPLIVVRGGRSCRLPQGWRESLGNGGSLRLCRCCRSYERNCEILDRFLRNRVQAAMP